MFGSKPAMGGAKPAEPKKELNFMEKMALKKAE